MQEYNNIHELVVKSSTKNYVTIGGYASVFGVIDNHNDIVIKGAFSNIDSIQNIKFLWQHDSTKPIGVITKALEDDYGLYIEANINSSINQGLEAIALVKQGAISSFSVGFTVKKASNNLNGFREIISADLWEISLVTFPANHHAQVQHIKSTDLIEKSINKALKAIYKLRSKI